MSAVGAHTALLSEHTRQQIDHWVAKFPPDRKRSAVLAALRFTQEQNDGHLTTELMDAVAEYLGLPPIQVRGRKLLFHVRAASLRAAPCQHLHQYFLHAARG
jgi:NADH:ubiquinone oxidoreductase subunit E